MAESPRVAVSDGGGLETRPQADTRPGILASERLLWILVLLGVALRLRQYAIDRSLWLDESFVALNLLGRGLHGLLSAPLDLNQAIPAGFLVAEKVSSQVFGKSEYALRAFPLVCGIAAIPLFLLVARRTLSSLAAPLALGLFVVSGPLVYYSSELKPYSADVVAVLALYVVSFDVLERRLTVARAVAFGLLGAVLIQLSYAAIFVVAGCGIVLLSFLLIDRRFDSIRALLCVVALWALGAILFLLFYVHSFRSYSGGTSPNPSPPGLFWHGPISWIRARVVDFADASGVYHSASSPLVIITLLTAALALVGAAELFLRRRRDFAVLVSPVVVTEVVTAAGKFPILARTILFLTPLVFLFVANGAVALVRLVRVRSAAVAVAAVAVVAVDVASFGGAAPFAPVRSGDIKSPLSYVARHWRKGDVLYVHYPSQYAFGYYEECDCFSLPGTRDLQSLWPMRATSIADPGEQFPRAFVSTTRRLIIGAPPWTNPSGDYKPDVDRISSHKRGWVLVTWTFSPGERDFMRKELFAPLDRRGKAIASIVGPGRHLYLYDFDVK